MDSAIRGMVDGYFRLFEMIRSKYKLDDDTALRLLQEVAKDIRMDRIRDERHIGQKVVPEQEAATERQLRYLENLGATPEKELTKAQASQLIDEMLAGQRGAGTSQGNTPQRIEDEGQEALDIEVMRI